MLYILDTYAWVEYFTGSKKGEIVRNLFKEKANEFLSIYCTLSELKGWSIKENSDFSKVYSTVRSNSHLGSISLEEWIDAAGIKSEMRKTRKDFGLIDALLLAKQKKYNCKVISGDPHFENLENVVYLK
ncbi:PIN domain-containing protein [Candidatus Micrarchaeota archaeon]|nr:PIN domain-containing protein [Candidatus Micrarchaeota archaeon]